MSQTVKKALSYSPRPDARVIGLYFSADYCKWCRDFTPKLLNLYPALHERDVEILLVGSDKTKEAYDRYKSHQPWPAVRFDDDIRVDLRDEFNIKTIPALIFVDQDGNEVNRDGRTLVDIAFLNEGSYQAVEWVASHIGVGASCCYDSDNSDF